MGAECEGRRMPGAARTRCHGRSPPLLELPLEPDRFDPHTPHLRRAIGSRAEPHPTDDEEADAC